MTPYFEGGTANNIKRLKNAHQIRTFATLDPERPHEKSLTNIVS